MLIDAGTFPWEDGRFPGLVDPSPGYRGLRYAETFGNFAFIMKARVETMRDLGPVLSPFNAFLLLQGLETLSLRMDRHVDNAEALARFLAGSPGGDLGELPGPARQPRARAGGRRYLPRGAGAVVTFGVRGGRDAGRRLIEACELCSHLANVGDAKTLIIHPASTTHRRLDEEGLAAGRASARTWCACRWGWRRSTTSSGTSTGRSRPPPPDLRAALLEPAPAPGDAGQGERGGDQRDQHQLVHEVDRQ